jgi:general stress protein 26
MVDKVKLSDRSKLVDFLNSHEALTMANPIDNEGTLHASAMLYYCTVDPLRFYFVTARDTDKCKPLKANKILQCAIVVGTERHTPFSIQMRGYVKEVKTSDNKGVIDGYYKKLKNHYDDVNDPANVLLEYTPTWARFTDYSEGYNRYYLDLS